MVAAAADIVDQLLARVDEAATRLEHRQGSAASVALLLRQGAAEARQSLGRSLTPPPILHRLGEVPDA